jgi:para-nitrobenzyl esterase
MQIGSLYGPPPEGKPWGAANLETFGKPVGSEDCLTLNVWRPDNAEIGRAHV